MIARRELMGLFAGGLASLAGLDSALFDCAFDCALGRALAGVRPLPPAQQRLWLKREAAGEEIAVAFRTDAGYSHAGLTRLSWHLRDIASANAAVWIEPRLFDLLAAVQGAMSAVHGAPLPLVVTSGYRTPGHNGAIEGAARSSLHVSAMAADLKAPGYPPGAIAAAAAIAAPGLAGGIGVYPGFCHLDVGRPRAWTRRGSASNQDTKDKDTQP